MAHLQYMPGDPRLVDQLVYELKSKGIFDQFRKDCIADVDTRPAYQNLRQRVENSVSAFLSRQCWKPDLNKNQLREKLRKHILDGNYLEQGVERIVDQVVNPKVASVFIPQVEDLVYNYLGISRKKSVNAAETSDGKVGTVDLLPTDLEAVSPGSVKSNDDKMEAMDEDNIEDNKMDVEETKHVKEEEKVNDKKEDETETITEEIPLPAITTLTIDSESSEDKTKHMPHDEIKLENIPAPENSPPKFELDKIEQSVTEVPHPDEIPLPNLPKEDKDLYFKPLLLPSDDDSSSDSSLRRNMSPLTPIRNYNNENSYDAQQGFDHDSDSKSNDKKEPSTFRFSIDAKSPENATPEKIEKKENNELVNVSYQFNNQVNINTFNTPLYDDSSNSNNLHIDYESDVNSKTNNIDNASEQRDKTPEDVKKDKKSEERKSSSSHKSSHRSRDSHRYSSSKDKRSDSKQSSSRDSSRHDKKSKDDHSKSKTSHREGDKSKDRSDKKDSRDSSRHRSSSHKSSSHKDAKSHRGSSSSQKPSTDKSDKRSSDDKRSSSSHKDRSERSSDKSSRDKRDSKTSSHRSDRDKDRKSSSSKSKHDDKDKKKDKKETDDHYSLSGRGNHNRRSTDRDSNDGSSSSKGSQNHPSSKTAENKKESKESSSKSDNASTSGDSASPCDKEQGVNKTTDVKGTQRPIRVENHLEVPIATPPRLPFVPDITLKKPKFAANLKEAKRMMRMRKFLDEEQKRMNQEAALLLEFQANVRPSLSQVYSSIPGPELEFACINHTNEVNNIEVQGYVADQVTSDLVPIDSDNVKEKEENQEVTVNKSEISDEVIEPLIDNTVIGEEDERNPSLERHKTYNENKPFSQLMEEISEISKASEKKKDAVSENVVDEENRTRTEYFEVTIITEELSETDEPANELANEESISNEHAVTIPENNEIEPIVKHITETSDVTETCSQIEEDNSLKYFAEDEKHEAELKRNQYSNFLKTFTEKISSNKVYLLNCDTYEENILREVFSTFGKYEIVNYYKNGHLKLPKTAKSVVKNVNLASEITLPLESNYESKSPYHSKSPSPVFSPVKSECSFELSSDYDAKLEEMVNKTSRQEVMEIILGSVIETDNPRIDYCMESSIESNLSFKRKIVELEESVNNNRQVLAKMRKLSDSDHISSTTEESEEQSNNNRVSNPPRSKYLGRARRVGLPRPKRTNLPNSPSSDKSVENYEQNTPATPQPTPNGKIKSAPRNKVQRYDTSDLYKPKLHYLSRRNNIS